MTNEIRRRRGLNYLGELGSKLRDLRGTATLAHELIQNAEDAIKDIVRPSIQEATISFRIDEQALIVDNGGVFSDCGHQDQLVCPWKSENTRPCDFHSFADVGGAAKRRAGAERGASGGLKGAFGFGFTAVYQVTDHPQLISNGRHWILEDHKPEDQRILECSRSDCEYCSASNLPGTRFVLRWAFDEASEVRKGLNAPIVSRQKPQELVLELAAALPQTILFLDHLRQMEVFWNQSEKVRVFVSDRSGPVLTVTTNGEAIPWALLTHNFADIAASLRMQHPEGEKYPTSEVKIAVPTGKSNDGLFFAYLPTQLKTCVPFHINADFFPSNDRKRLLLENDYQGEWNRAAIRAGAKALSGGLLSLREHLGPKGFWELLGKVYVAAHDRESLLGPEYWNEVVPILRKGSVVPVQGGGWETAAKVRLQSEKDSGRFTDLHAELGILTVHPDVVRHRPLLLHVGVQQLNSVILASHLHLKGLSGELRLNELPQWFKTASDWNLVWQQIADVLNRESDSDLSPIAKSKQNAIADCSVVKCVDDVFRTCRNTFRVDSQTRSLFAGINPNLHFASDVIQMHAAVGWLIPEFTVSDAISAITPILAPKEVAGHIGLNTSNPISTETAITLLAWCNTRIEVFRSSSEHLEALKKLRICPTAKGLQSFDQVVLPGGFSDPIGVTCVADSKSLETVGPLVQLLQLRTLSLNEYITVWLADAFQEAGTETNVCRTLLRMLSMHQGEIYNFENSEQVRNELRGLKIIPCEDGVLRAVKTNLYFQTPLVKDVLADSVSYVDDSFCTKAIRTLLDWLGVESQPRLDRVVSYMITTAAQTLVPNQDVVDKVVSLLDHLGSRFEELSRHEPLLKTLRVNPWLPSRRTTFSKEFQKIVYSKTVEWALPTACHYSGTRHLIETIGVFPSFPVKMQDAYRGLLKSIGVQFSPTALSVIQHLREASRSLIPVDPRVYHFVNKALEDGEIDKSKISDLRTKKCLFDKRLNQFVRPQDCFSEEQPFGSHRVQLGSEDLTALKELLTALDIRSRPTWEDAVEVLSEISRSDDARLKRKISIDEKRIVLACWRLLESALNDDDADTTDVCNKLGKLAELPVVCRADNLLDLPSNVFFRDREHLAEALAGSLNAELIRMPQGAMDALTRAGVRRLSEVTGIHITHDEADQREAQFVASRIQERAELLVNVVETCRSVRQKASLPDLKKLRVLEANTLTVDLTFNGFSRPLPPVRHSVVAIIEKSPETLWYRLDDGLPPWDAIACELARLCLDSDDVAQLSAAVNAAIEPESLRRAQRKLSQLGFPSIEISDDSQGATEAPPAFGIHGVQSPAEFQHEESSDTASVFTQNAIRPASGVTSEGTLVGRSPETSAGPMPTVINEMVGGRQHSASHRRQETTTDNHPPAGQQKWAEKSVPMSDDEQPFIDWLVGQSGATDRRKQKILEASSEADRRRSEYRQRKQRVHQIPTEEVLLYLKNFYSRNNRFRCQMMTEGDSDLHEMPFWKSSEQMYSGKEEMFNRQMAQLLPYALPESKELNLFLCPNCAAIYTKFIASQPEQQLRLFEWVHSDESKAGFNIDCTLSGKQPNRSLYFHPKHLDDIRSVDGVFEASNAPELGGGD